ncbi:hypothetical protein EDC19_1222 [Natranaerovirga hydrolytica]|uniref:PH (Pleckstrin Homology) domain-containing protein n=1 Tax=Natranaerovirga hydrolytica TaxID=680378 RepID=A0A4R1MZL8_9FIRM|nr:DUF6106 family protein [Natranaerovirga hydrolytica]TCK98787.1 hypothetical protein EDC19_1222 [Natranaerovirga hydrolytica]
MEQVFVEQIVKREQTAKDVIIKIVIVLMTMLLMTASIVLGIVGMIISVLLLWLAHRLFTNLNVEYEYALAVGEVDIDKIMNKTRRKKLINFGVKDIKLVAPAFSKLHEKNLNDYNRLYNFTKGRLTEETYAMLVTTDKEKYKIYVDLNEEFIKALKNHIPKQVMDK